MKFGTIRDNDISQKLLVSDALNGATWLSVLGQTEWWVPSNGWTQLGELVTEEHLVEIAPNYNMASSALWALTLPYDSVEARVGVSSMRDDWRRNAHGMLVRHSKRICEELALACQLASEAATGVRQKQLEAHQGWWLKLAGFKNIRRAWLEDTTLVREFTSGWRREPQRLRDEGGQTDDGLYSS